MDDIYFSDKKKSDKNGKYLKLVAFYAPEDWLNLDPEFDHIEPLVKLTENDYNGVKSVEAWICDIIVSWKKSS